MHDIELVHGGVLRERYQERYMERELMERRGDGGHRRRHELSVRLVRGVSRGGGTVDGSGNVYLVDTENHRIQKFTSTGTFITEWGGGGTGDGQFSTPQGIDIDTSGRVYVADAGNNRIQVFDTDGTFITKWGSWGTGDGELITPSNMITVGSDTIYVVESGNNRVQKFTIS